MLNIFFDLAKNGVTTGINAISQRNFQSAFQETLKEFEERTYVTSRTDLENFFKSTEFKSHLALHVDDRNLNFIYLGDILREYTNIPKDFSAESILENFF